MKRFFTKLGAALAASFNFLGAGLLWLLPGKVMRREDLMKHVNRTLILERFRECREHLERLVGMEGVKQPDKARLVRMSVAILEITENYARPGLVPDPEEFSRAVAALAAQPELPDLREARP